MKIILGSQSKSRRKIMDEMGLDVGLIKSMDLPAGKFALFGSAPMGIRGLKRCDNIDLIVTEDVFGGLKDQEDWMVKTSANGSEYLNNGVVEVFKDWKPGEWDIEKLISEAEMIDGMPFVKLEFVLEWKKMASRAKDLEDIKIIEDYINKNTNH